MYECVSVYMNVVCAHIWVYVHVYLCVYSTHVSVCMQHVFWVDAYQHVEHAGTLSSPCV